MNFVRDGVPRRKRGRPKVCKQPAIVPAKKLKQSIKTDDVRPAVSDDTKPPVTIATHVLDPSGLAAERKRVAENERLSRLDPHYARTKRFVYSDFKVICETAEVNENLKKHIEQYDDENKKLHLERILEQCYNVTKGDVKMCKSMMKKIETKTSISLTRLPTAVLLANEKKLENVIDKKIKHLFGEEFFECDKKILRGKYISSFNTSKQHVSSSETEISEDGDSKETISIVQTVEKPRFSRVISYNSNTSCSKENWGQKDYLKTKTIDKQISKLDEEVSTMQYSNKRKRLMSKITSNQLLCDNSFDIRVAESSQNSASVMGYELRGVLNSIQDPVSSDNITSESGSDVKEIIVNIDNDVALSRQYSNKRKRLMSKMTSNQLLCNNNFDIEFAESLEIDKVKEIKDNHLHEVLNTIQDSVNSDENLLKTSTNDNEIICLSNMEEIPIEVIEKNLYLIHHLHLVQDTVNSDKTILETDCNIDKIKDTSKNELATALFFKNCEHINLETEFNQVDERSENVPSEMADLTQEAVNSEKTILKIDCNAEKFKDTSKNELATVLFSKNCEHINSETEFNQVDELSKNVPSEMVDLTQDTVNSKKTILETDCNIDKIKDTSKNELATALFSKNCEHVNSETEFNQVDQRSEKVPSEMDELTQDVVNSKKTILETDCNAEEIKDSSKNEFATVLFSKNCEHINLETEFNQVDERSEKVPSEMDELTQNNGNSEKSSLETDSDTEQIKNTSDNELSSFSKKKEHSILEKTYNTFDNHYKVIDSSEKPPSEKENIIDIENQQLCNNLANDSKKVASQRIIKNSKVWNDILSKVSNIIDINNNVFKNSIIDDLVSYFSNTDFLFNPDSFWEKYEKCVVLIKELIVKLLNTFNDTKNNMVHLSGCLICVFRDIIEKFSIPLNEMESKFNIFINIIIKCIKEYIDSQFWNMWSISSVFIYWCFAVACIFIPKMNNNKTDFNEKLLLLGVLQYLSKVTQFSYVFKNEMKISKPKTGIFEFTSNDDLLDIDNLVSTDINKSETKKVILSNHCIGTTNNIQDHHVMKKTQIKKKVKSINKVTSNKEVQSKIKNVQSENNLSSKIVVGHEFHIENSFKNSVHYLNNIKFHFNRAADINNTEFSTTKFKQLISNMNKEYSTTIQTSSVQVVIPPPPYFTIANNSQQLNIPCSSSISSYSSPYYNNISANTRSSNQQLPVIPLPSTSESNQYNQSIVNNCCTTSNNFYNNVPLTNVVHNIINNTTISNQYNNAAYNLPNTQFEHPSAINMLSSYVSLNPGNTYNNFKHQSNGSLPSVSSQQLYNTPCVASYSGFSNNSNNLQPSNGSLPSVSSQQLHTTPYVASYSGLSNTSKTLKQKSKSGSIPSVSSQQLYNTPNVAPYLGFSNTSKNLPQQSNGSLPSVLSQQSYNNIPNIQFEHPSSTNMLSSYVSSYPRSSNNSKNVQQPSNSTLPSATSSIASSMRIGLCQSIYDLGQTDSNCLPAITTLGRNFQPLDYNTQVSPDLPDVCQQNMPNQLDSNVTGNTKNGCRNSNCTNDAAQHCCSIARYCSQKCLQTDWYYHKNECSQSRRQ